MRAYRQRTRNVHRLVQDHFIGHETYRNVTEPAALGSGRIANDQVDLAGISQIRGQAGHQQIIAAGDGAGDASARWGRVLSYAETFGAQTLEKRLADNHSQLSSTCQFSNAAVHCDDLLERRGA